MESEPEDKQKEIKLLRDKYKKTGNENPQLIALKATLKHKEAEIEELKHRLEKKELWYEEGGIVAYKGDVNGTRSNFPKEEDNRGGVEDASEKQEIFGGISGMDGKRNDANASGDMDEQGKKNKGGNKLEIDEISKISRLPGKKWRILARRMNECKFHSRWSGKHEKVEVEVFQKIL
ncbi:hypothetical protein PTKIN_Ptkin10aG0074300 [Pterospermum kingtungense]